jgi:hypothetical protein
MTDPASGRNSMKTATLAAALALLAATAPARADLLKVETFSLYSDFRLRAETDWDSRDAAGVERIDRTRMRVRMRIGFLFDPTENWRVEARLRGGQEGSQQSPHITILDFDDNDTGDASFNFDRWYVRGKRGGFEAWAGRNDLPFWKQDELMFDDDVTMPGVTVRWEKGKLALAGGYYSPPVGMTLFTGNMAAGQVAWQPELGGVRLAFAGGAYLFDANPTDMDNGGLLQGNGMRDYSILAASVQARWSPGGRPLVFGADAMHNTEDYSPTDPDPVTAANFDETDGYVLLGTYGGLSKHNDWLVGYYYARIETFAVNNSYSQDDWVRWGSATQTRASDMQGHEVRFGWAFDPKMNLMARLYIAEAITTVEDGKRFRVDFNYKF